MQTKIIFTLNGEQLATIVAHEAEEEHIQGTLAMIAGILVKFQLLQEGNLTEAAASDFLREIKNVDCTHAIERSYFDAWNSMAQNIHDGEDIEIHIF